MKDSLTGLGKNGVLQETAGLAEDEMGRIWDGAGYPCGTVQHHSATGYGSCGVGVGERAPGEGPTQ